MNRNWYAINARDLLEQRRHGNRPANPVSVVMDGGDAVPPVLHLRSDMPIERMDWRMLVNVEVWLWAGLTVPLDRMKRVAHDIADVAPSRLVLRFTGRDEQVHDVEIGSGSHRSAIAAHGIPAEHEFIWCPINLSGTPLAAQLRRALH